MNTTKFLHTQLLKTPQFTTLFHIPTSLHPRPRRSLLTCNPIFATDTDNGENNTPVESVEIRFRRGTRKRQKEQENMYNDPPKAITPPKKWDDMSLSEKALELYVGEKGLLYWLNKFAYASIFIIIGGWILFRFVGPALNLYQLDAEPLAPKDLFKG